MSGEDLAVLKAVSDIIHTLGALPIGSLLVAVIFGPWIVMTLLNASQNKKFDAVAKMYESNARLVKKYEEVVDSLRQQIEGQQELIIMASTTMRGLDDSIKANLFCPLVRDKTKPREPHG